MLLSDIAIEDKDCILSDTRKYMGFDKGAGDMRKKNIEEICKTYRIGLCYLFGSQAETGKTLIEGGRVDFVDPEGDIDFGVVFTVMPEDSLKEYAELSIEFQSLVSPCRADLLFLHEVDHLFQLEVIKGINIYAVSEEFREAYEEMVSMFASDEYEIFKLNEMDMFRAIEDGYFEFEYKIDRR